MGFIADTVSTPEFIAKPPLEKAQARRDLFAQTLKSNPEVFEQFTSSDDAGKQAMADKFKGDLETSFPNSFRADGYHVTLRPDGAQEWKGETYDSISADGKVTQKRDPIKTPIYDIGTEQILAALQDPAKREEVKALSKEVRAAIAPFAYERYGPKFAAQNEDILGKPEDHLKVDESTGKKILNFVIPGALRMAPAIAASVLTRGKPNALPIIASFGAAGEAAAQNSENILGTRRGYSPAEIGLNGLMSIIPAATIGKLVNPMLNMAAQVGVRGLEGAAQGGGYEAAREVMAGEKLSGEKIGATAMFGAGLGALIGGLPPAYAALFSGKSKTEASALLPKIIASASEADKPALTAWQKSIDESLNIGVEGKSASESATTFSSALNEPAPAAKNTVLAGQEIAAQDPALSTIDKVSAMGAEDFFKWSREQPKGITGESYNVGIAIIGSPEKIKALRSAGEAARQEFSQALEQMKTLSGPELAKASDEIGVLAVKHQFFEEALGAAENSGSASHSPQVAQAHADYEAAISSRINQSPQGASGLKSSLSAEAQEAARVAEATRITQEGTGEDLQAAMRGNQVRGETQLPVEDLVDQAARQIRSLNGSKATDITTPMSKQAATLADKWGRGKEGGYVDPTLVRALTSGASATGGFVVGFNSDDKASLEDRIKNGLTVAVIGAAGGYALGSSFSKLQPGGKSTGVLAEIDAHIGALEKPPFDWRGIPNKARTAFTTRFAPLDRLPGLIAEANGTTAIVPELPLSRQFELVNGAAAKGAAAVTDFGDTVVSKVGGKDYADFNRLIFTKRTGQRLQWNRDNASQRAAILNQYGDEATLRAYAKANPGDPNLIRDIKILDGVQDKSVEGWDLNKVDSALSELRTKLGPARFSELDQLAAGPMQQKADEALQVLVGSGRMSPETYSAIKAGNDFYAPFRIMKYADDFDGFSRSGAGVNPVDTKARYTRVIEGISDPEFKIDDPTRVLAEKIGQARVLGEKNRKMLLLAAQADTDPSGTIIKRLAANEDIPHGMQAVNYFDNGEPLRLAVSEDVAQAVRGMNPVETGFVANLAVRFNKTFRFGATGGNVAFQTVNAPFDQLRLATTAKMGIGAGGLEDVYRYPADFVTALYTSIFGSASGAKAAGAVGGFYAGYETGDTPGEKFARGAAGAALGYAAGGTAKGGIQKLTLGTRFDPASLYRSFQNSGAAGSTIQDMVDRLSGREMPASIATEVSQPTKGVIGTLEDFGKVVEETTKIMGFQRGMRLADLASLAPEKAADELEKVASEVRNYAGSPDFARSGNVGRDLNTILLFINPRIQGFTQDVARMVGRDGAKPAIATWTRLGGAAGLGASYLWYLNHAPENAQDFNQVSPDEKNRYGMVPRYGDDGKPIYFKNDKGQQVREYWRVPMRDTAQILAQVTSSALDFAADKDPEAVAKFGVQLLENISPVNISGKTIGERAESMISNTGPIATIPYLLALHRNPGLHRDIYGDRNMVNADPEQRFSNTTPEVYKRVAGIMPQWMADPARDPIMLEQLVQATTGGIVNQFTPPKEIPGRDASATAMQQSPLGKRFVRSNYVYSDAPKEADSSLREQANLNVEERRSGGKLLDELSQLPPDKRAERAAQLSPIELKSVEQEWKGRQSRSFDAEIQKIKLMDTEHAIRAKYIFDRVNSLEGEERKKFAEELKASGVLSSGVLKQLDILARK